MANIEESVGAVYDSIETKLWVVQAHFREGADELALECLHSALHTYVRFAEALRAYSGSDELHRRIQEQIQASRSEESAPRLAA